MPDAAVTGATIQQTWREMNGGALDAPATLTQAGALDTGKAVSRQRASVGATTPQPRPLWAQRQDYCTEWWRAATSGQIPNLEVCCRDGVAASVKASLASEADKPSDKAGQYGGAIHEKGLLEDYATHHQKPILIDYAFEGGRKAVGYVMGLNSLSDYWDTEHHLPDEPLRERHLNGENDGMANAALRGGKPISRKPLQDYACRLQGPVLQDVHANFCNAWARAQLLPLLPAASNANSRPGKSAEPLQPLPPLLGKAGHKHSDATGPAYRAALQIARTQPEEGRDTVEGCLAYDKGIKEAYFQASSFARNYIYLENQYFFYEEWARHLKANRVAFMEWVQAAGKTSRDARLLHLMAVIPLPENEGMVPRTYDTLRSLGHADSMPKQHEHVTTEAAQAWNANSEVTKTALAVKTPTLDKDGVLLQDGKSLGLKVLVCKMAAPNVGDQAARQGKSAPASRDIYIHSKLLLIDDCFMTLGSANLNQRSMAADSEINVCTDSIPHNRDLRKRVWGMQTGGQYDGGKGTPTQEEMVETFKQWKKLAQTNADAIGKGASSTKMNGFLVKFTDIRVSTTRVA